jgi:hypothetical protein
VAIDYIARTVWAFCEHLFKFMAFLFHDVCSNFYQYRFIIDTPDYFMFADHPLKYKSIFFFNYYEGASGCIGQGVIYE